MKKLISSFFASLLCISLITSVALAEQSVSESEINNYLINAGYPQTTIDRLVYDQKITLYENNAIFVTEKFVPSNLIESNSNVYLPTDITPLALSNFGHSITVSQVTASSSSKVAFAVDYNWYWDYSPVWTLTDKFGLAWTDSFRLKSGTARTGYNVVGTCGGRYYQKTYPVSTSFYNGIDGIGWDVDLVGMYHVTDCPPDNRVQVKEHRGWGQFIMEKVHDGSNKLVTSAISASYFHKQVGLTGTLGFSATGPAVTITNSISYDESYAAYEDWDWVQKTF